MKIQLAAVVSLFAATLSAQLQETSFYVVRPVQGTPPVIDGRILDDPGWEKAERHTNYYVYLDQNPGPAKTKTEFRMLYDDKGLYLAILNWGDTTKLKATVTRPDDPNLWSDDSAELYFDNECTGLQYRKFMVNSKGTRADSYQFDPQNVSSSWNANGWTNGTIVFPNPENLQEGCWTIESFFPWEDLGGKAAPGDIRAFNHCRFSMGIWQLSTSSPGGGYYNPVRFGRIYFAPDYKKLDEKTIAKLLDSKTPPPWCMEVGDNLWKNESGKIECESISEKIRRSEKNCAEQLALVQKEMEGITNKARISEFEKLQKAAPDEKSAGLNRAIRFDEYASKLRNFYWELSCDKTFKQ